MAAATKSPKSRAARSSAKANASITVDYNNCLIDAVGPEHGLKPSDLNSLAKRAPKIAATLAAQRKAGQLPYRDLPYQQGYVSAILKSVRAKQGRFDNVVVLGIGGSALGTSAVQTACNHPYYNLLTPGERQRPRLFVCDNIDPVQFGSLLDLVDAKRTLFIPISKSGATAETMSQFLICRDLLKRRLGKKFAENLVAITDLKKGYLRTIAEQEGYETFPVPDGVGGRFSVMAPVGLFPLAMVGVDIARLLAGAAAMDQRCLSADLYRNPAFLAGAVQYLYYQKGKRLSVMMPYSSALKDVADWYCQLWAESLGKIRTVGGRQENVGPTPIKALGVTDQHSQVQLYREGPNDKIFTLLAVGQFGRDLEIPLQFPNNDGTNYLGKHSMGELLDAERRATTFALTKSKRPNVTLTLPVVDEYTVGQLLYMLMTQTSFTGELLGINTYDQPGVEEGKIATYALMGRQGFAEVRREINAKKGSPKNVVK